MHGGGKRKNLEKTRCREFQGSRGVWGGPGGSRGSRGGPEALGGKTAKKHEKTRKTLRNCMASLLRSNIQNFVEEVPLGQMAQGILFRCLPSRKRKGEVPSVQHATQGSADIYIYIHTYLILVYLCLCALVLILEKALLDLGDARAALSDLSKAAGPRGASVELRGTSLPAVWALSLFQEI